MHKVTSDTSLDAFSYISVMIPNRKLTERDHCQLMCCLTTGQRVFFVVNVKAFSFIFSIKLSMFSFVTTFILYIRSGTTITCDNDNNCIMNCNSTNCTYSSFVNNRTNLSALSINCNGHNSCSNLNDLQSMLFERQHIKILTINCIEQSSCMNMKLFINIVDNATNIRMLTKQITMAA